MWPDRKTLPMAINKAQADRLKELIEKDYHTTPAKFARKWGDERAQILYNVFSGTNNITNNLLDKICTAYPEINRAWILTGQGEKFIDPTTAPDAEQRTRDVEIERLQEIIASQQRTIEMLTSKLTKE